ncbi:MAG TPA: 5'-3' exonuclease H3TH domain-containing protein [Acidobacteriota bacterium]|nr:5'-3' exonuclease H3TH domain-containing protein [Acidobacteriota bacterium]
MKVHLVDGTYELFRHFYAIPKRRNSKGQEIAATRGVVLSMLNLLSESTHVAVATDHIIESFRNELWPDYKDGSGIDPDLRSQFSLLEDALQSLNMIVWPMIEYEADDALAAGAAICSADPRVEQVVICTPDKDLAQCVSGDHVVQLDRRRKRLLNEEAVVAKFGVLPKSIPDYLALVGDSADGYPGIAGWGAISASRALRKFTHLEKIPKEVVHWKVDVTNAGRLSATLKADWENALLYRRLATLVVDGPVRNSVDDLFWNSPTPSFEKICEYLESPDFVARAHSLSQARSKLSD